MPSLVFRSSLPELVYLFFLAFFLATESPSFLRVRRAVLDGICRRAR